MAKREKDRGHGKGFDDIEERPERVPEEADDAPEYPTPGGAQPAGTGTGPVHDLSFRPGPGGTVQADERRGKHIPYTGEASSTRDATFEEDPYTGKTADEEDGEYLRESLEKRTRGYEGG